MMNNVVFTIVAKNFLPFARTLGDSILKIHKDDLEYFIFLVDESEGLINFEKERYKIIETGSLRIENYMNMAFRYDVIEFSTALKPFIISYLFQKGYDKIIYLDPDISLYNPLDGIYEKLDSYSMVITPHINHPIESKICALDEESLLFYGIYNLGFVAIKKDVHTLNILDWWMKKLYDSCFNERARSIFVDQKWMNFINAFLGEKVLITRNPGYNMSVWNLQERRLRKNDNGYEIVDKANETAPLTFYHFSGYHPSNKDYISYKQPSLSFEMFPELKELFDSYREKLIVNGAPGDFKIKYTFAGFENGENITKLHRRLFNSMLLSGVEVTNPFSVNEKSFYSLLKKNNLLSKTGGLEPEKVGMEQFDKYSKKIRFVNFLLRTFQRFVGIEKYALFLRFLTRAAKYDSQLFLIKKK